MFDTDRIGWCPRCGEGITGGGVLIMYETYAGRRVYAECPDCQYVAHPDPEK